MNKRVLVGVGLVVLVVLAAGAVWFDPTRVLLGHLRGESFFRDRPTSYWRGALRASNPVTQSETYQALKDGREAAVPVLVELLQDKGHSDWMALEVRWRSAELLGQIGPPAKTAVPALAAALKDPDPHVRSVAATALGQVGQDASVAIPALVTTLAGEDKLSAVKALGHFGAEANRPSRSWRSCCTPRPPRSGGTRPPPWARSAPRPVTPCPHSAARYEIPTLRCGSTSPWRWARSAPRPAPPFPAC